MPNTCPTRAPNVAKHAPQKQPRLPRIAQNTPKRFVVFGAVPHRFGAVWGCPHQLVAGVPQGRQLNWWCPFACALGGWLQGGCSLWCVGLVGVFLSTAPPKRGESAPNAPSPPRTAHRFATNPPQTAPRLGACFGKFRPERIAFYCCCDNVFKILIFFSIYSRSAKINSIQYCIQYIQTVLTLYGWQTALRYPAVGVQGRPRLHKATDISQPTVRLRFFSFVS